MSATESQEPVNQEDAVSALNEAKKDKNIEAIFNDLVLVIDSFQKDADYVSVLSILDEDGSNPLFTLAMQEKLLSYRITALLRLEDYNGLLSAIKERENIGEESEIDRANIGFYKAIAYEALDEYDKAIEALNQIIDNIPRYSLINKYLKLALLYLKVGKIGEAKSAYDYAALVDFNRKNEMFPLVESDLFYASNKYAEALDSFETFFLKSPNKYKYLDRYILIEIKLNHLDDAYLFYQEYKDKSGIRLSRQNRYRFLVASLSLLKALSRNDEVIEVTSLLEGLKPVYFEKAEAERNAIISSLTHSLAYPISIYDSNKNVVNRFFKLVSGLNSISLSYIEKSPDGYRYFLFDPNKMKEKDYSYEDLKKKSLSNVFVYHNETILPSFVDINLVDVKGRYLALSLSDEYHDFGLIVVQGKDDDIGVYRVLRDVIFASLIRLEERKEGRERENEISSSLALKREGFMHISGDFVSFYDPFSMALFGLKTDMISFDVFRNLEKNKDFYVDSFKEGTTVDLPFLIGEKEKLYRFECVSKSNGAFVFVKDVTEIVAKETQEQDFILHSGLRFYNASYLEKRISLMNDSYALIGINAKIIEAQDALIERDSKLETFYNYLRQASPSSELYYLGENHYLLLLNSTDKRVIEAAYRSITNGFKQLYRLSSSLKEEDVNGFATKSLKKKNFKEIEAIISYGYGYADKKKSFVFLDNDEKKEYALYKTYEGEIIRRLKESNLKISYAPIVDHNNDIHYFLLDFELPYDLSHSAFELILANNLLESKADQVLVEKAFNEMMPLNPALRFIIPLHPETIYNDNFIKKTCVLFKKCHLENRIIFSVKNIGTEAYNKALASLMNAGIKLGTTFTNLSDLKDLEKYRLVFADFKGSPLY